MNPRLDIPFLLPLRLYRLFSGILLNCRFRLTLRLLPIQFSLQFLFAFLFLRKFPLPFLK